MARQLRIAIYHDLSSGGAKRTLFEIVKRLGERHHLDMYNLSCSDHDFCDIRRFGAETHTYSFNPLPQFQRPLGRVDFAARLLDLLRLDRIQRRIAADIDRRRYDVVHLHPCQFARTPTLLHFLQTPSVYYSHEPLRAGHYEPVIARPYRSPRRRVRLLLDRLDPLAKAYRRRLESIDRRCTRRATSVLTNSYFTREALYRFYGVNARVCYHGVDSETFRPLGLPRDGFVLSVGALTPAKGFDLIIQSLGLVPAGTRPPLTIVSNYQVHDELAYLRDLAKQSGVSAEFRTMVSNEELVRLYNTALMTVYAPILEPFGLVPLESMACGTPVVAVREGGVRESVVDGHTGLLTDRDPERFARAVKMLLEDTALATRLGQQGRAYVAQEWNWDRSVRQIEAALIDAARGRHARAQVRRND